MFPRFFAAALASMLLLSGLVMPTAYAAKTTTSTVSLPFSGSFYDLVTQEMVDISGSVNVTTHTTLGSTLWTTTLYAALPANIKAVGESSGATYLANGAAQLALEYPPGPIMPVFAQIPFVLWPPGPIFPPGPIRPSLDQLILRLNLIFASDGSLVPFTCQLDSRSGSSVVGVGDTFVSCDTTVNTCP